jgi:hypothetical protein
MDKYRTAFGACAAALIVLALLAYTQLEIYPRSRPTPPSREVRANDYFALDRWLQETGHPVRIEPGAPVEQITAAPEKTIFLQTSLLDWRNISFATMEPWLAGGRRLILSLDTPWYEDEDEDLAAFLSALGLRRESIEDLSDFYALLEPESESEAAGTGEDETREETGEIRENPLPAVPDFDPYVILTLDTEQDTPGGIVTMEDPQDIIRLVTVPVGTGSVTVTGDAYFMQNLYIDRDVNARLAWELTGGGDDENRGILFIRGRRIIPSLWGNLAERGNPGCLILSILVLAGIGFWMLVPVFGRVRRDEEPPGKPLRERFLAEARFLKKYRGLDLYVDIYIRELRSRLRRQGYDDKEIARFIPAKPGPEFRDFVKFRETIDTISERL